MSRRSAVAMARRFTRIQKEKRPFDDVYLSLVLFVRSPQLNQSQEVSLLCSFHRSSSRLDALFSAPLPARLDSRPRAHLLSSSSRFRPGRTKVCSFAVEQRKFKPSAPGALANAVFDGRPSTAAERRSVLLCYEQSGSLC